MTLEPTGYFRACKTGLACLDIFARAKMILRRLGTFVPEKPSRPVWAFSRTRKNDPAPPGHFRAFEIRSACLDIFARAKMTLEPPGFFRACETGSAYLDIFARAKISRHRHLTVATTQFLVPVRGL